MPDEDASPADQARLNTRTTIDRCRRLAAIVSDQTVAEQLLQLAEKMELSLQDLSNPMDKGSSIKD